MACILPGRARPGARFWANILAKVDAITEVPADRWDWRAVLRRRPHAPRTRSTRAGAASSTTSPFDPLAFGIPPTSLRSIEPVQLLGLEAAHAALRDAGYADRPFAARAHVGRSSAPAAAAPTSASATRCARRCPRCSATRRGRARRTALDDALPEWTEDSFPGMLINVTAGRIANRLDLGGAELHRRRRLRLVARRGRRSACASSQTGTSDMVARRRRRRVQNPFAYLCFAKTHALSPTGRCRPFDADADGIALGEGVAAVVLKRLRRRRARRRPDLRRHQGRRRGRATAATSASPRRGRRASCARSSARTRRPASRPPTVGLVEAHGTGTVVGDRTELEALSTRVRARPARRRQACALGSVKSMIGHTKAPPASPG